MYLFIFLPNTENVINPYSYIMAKPLIML